MKKTKNAAFYNRTQAKGTAHSENLKKKNIRTRSQSVRGLVSKFKKKRLINGSTIKKHAKG